MMERLKRTDGLVSFARLWAGNTASGVATWALPFVLGFAVSQGQLSASCLGMLLAVRTVGFLVAVPVSGVLADRAGSRPMILRASMIAACGAVLVMFSLGSVTLAGRILAMAGMVLSGAGQGGCRPVYQSIVPLVVARHSLQSANAAFSLSVRATNLVGPAAAILIATVFGLQAAFFAIVVLWFISAIVPPWPDEPPRPAGPPSGKGPAGVAGRMVRDLAEGIREARRHPWFIAGLLALTAVIGAGYSVTNVLLPVISNQAQDGANLLAGATMSLLLGALAGAVVMVRWRPAMRGWWALGGLGIYGIVPLGLLAPQQYWIPICAYFIAGFGLELFNIIWFTAIQQEIPPDRLARVSSLDFIASYGLAPAGLVMMAPLTAHFGMEPVLLASAIICFGAPLIAAAFPTVCGFRAASSRKTSNQKGKVT